jgi:uncharacterized protein YbjT (DUF2867 family)
LVAESDAPYSIVRSTQFFEFLRGVANAAAAANVSRVYQALIQPIAAEDVGPLSPW